MNYRDTNTGSRMRAARLKQEEEVSMIIAKYDYEIRKKGTWVQL